MARSACLVARMFQFQRMRVMTVGTADLFVIHLALQERTKLIHFVFDLAVVKVGRSTERF